MEQQPDVDGAEGRLVYLVENLATLHAASDMPWLAGRFEFLGEKALGAALSVLALPDETGTYRAAASASPRTVTARDLWTALDIDNLPSNAAAAAVFSQAESKGRATHYPISKLFPGSTHATLDSAIVAPVSFNRELIGVAVFIVESSALTETMATMLAIHTAVAIHQLREREEARRLHSMDPRLWVPDEYFLMAQLRREVARSRRYGRELGVALLRFDSEPEVRAKLGDFYTDHLMRRIGSQILAKLRDTDVVGALDGAYAVIHTETSLEGTEFSSERLRDSVLQMIAQRFPELTDVRLSMRTVSFPEGGTTAEDLANRLTEGAAGETASLAA
jgi:diguanylate cyclase (GGDEF)-like protein